MKTGKVWGTTTLLLKTPLIEIHKLEILPNCECSMHKHNYKWNAFYIISGKLKIEVKKNKYNLVDITEIDKGQFTTVQPGEFHKFISGEEPVEALEIYYPEELSEDIIREGVGGKILKGTPILLNEKAK